MKLTVPQCPTCQRHAIGTVDVLPATALFNLPGTTGEVEYSGTSEIYWDSQHTQRGESQLPLLTCGEHEWESEIAGVEG